MAKKLKCDECSGRKPGVKRVADPFNGGMIPGSWMRNLCPPCYQARKA